MATATPPSPDDEIDLHEPFVRLSKDMKKASRGLSQREATWLVSTYYALQKTRIGAGGQVRSAEKDVKPHELVRWAFAAQMRLEQAVKSVMGEFAATYRVGQWIQSLYGFGPVISGAMLANFDIRKAPTVGHFWRFAGLDPTCIWEKKTKRPWNAELKSICCFRLGETLVKFWNRKECFYGQMMQAHKLQLQEANARGDYAKQATAEMEAKPKLKGRPRWKHWEEGRLCPDHIHCRARRWAVKLFISHLHHVMYRDFYEKDPPHPYIFDHPELGNHTHLIDPPNWPGEFDGKRLRELLQ